MGLVEKKGAKVRGPRKQKHNAIERGEEVLINGSSFEGLFVVCCCLSNRFGDRALQKMVLTHLRLPEEIASN